MAVRTDGLMGLGVGVGVGETAVEFEEVAAGFVAQPDTARDKAAKTAVSVRIPRRSTPRNADEEPAPPSPRSAHRHRR